MHRKAHLLTKSELKARGITRYDAEMLLAQGLPLPKLRADRSIAATITSNPELTPTTSTGFHVESSTSPTSDGAQQKIPKLKLRRQRLSDTETDSSGTSSDTLQPYYEILSTTNPPPDDGSALMALPSENGQNMLFQATDENTDTQSSNDGYVNLVTGDQATKTCFKRVKLRFDGNVDVRFNVTKQKL